MGALTFTPSFRTWIIPQGDGKDLGHALNLNRNSVFINFSENSKIGISYNHVSNASIGDKNPGANSYMFNFFKNF
jgi:hypothetical protein